MSVCGEVENVQHEIKMLNKTLRLAEFDGNVLLEQKLKELKSRLENLQKI